MDTSTAEPNNPLPQPRGKRLSGLALLAIALAVIVSVAFQGSRGLYESTEGRYAQCAKETMESGSLLEPMLNGDHHWSKPPLAYLPIAAGIKLLGNNAWGARGFQAILFILTVIAVFIAGREIWDTNAGALAALVYATSPFTAGAAFTVSTDNMLVLFEGLAVAFFWLAIRRQRPIYTTLMWSALGLAFLTKGPVGLFPLLGIIPAHSLLRRQARPVPPLLRAPGLLAFGIIGIGWYALEIMRHPELLNTWLLHETLGRLTSDEFHRNAEFHKIFTLYLPILLFGTGPWLACFLFKYRQTGLRPQRLREWRRWTDRVEWTFLLALLLFPLAILVVSHSRLPLYLLPLFFPIALAMGKGLALLLSAGYLQRRTIITTACCMALLFVVVKGASAWYPSRKNMAQLAEGLRPALADHPHTPLVLVYGEPLNGLEFYLDRQIPVHEFAFPGATKEEEKTADDRPPQTVTLQSGTLVLARTKHLRTATALLPQGLANPLYEDPNWTLVQLNRPLNLH